MTRTYVNALKNFRSEGGIVKFDLGEEAMSQGGVQFINALSVAMSEADFVGMSKFLANQLPQFEENSTPREVEILPASEVREPDIAAPRSRKKIS